MSDSLLIGFFEIMGDGVKKWNYITVARKCDKLVLQLELKQPMFRLAGRV